MTDPQNAAFGTRDAKVWPSTGAPSPRSLNPEHSFNITQTDLQIRVKRHFGRPKLKRLKVLAIDEIYIGKAKKFLTIVIDWTTGAIVFVGKGKGEQA